MKKVSIEAVKSKIITPDDALIGVILTSLGRRGVQNGDILAMSSKVVAITQGRVKKLKTTPAFNKLVEEEADEVIGGKEVTLTLKNGIFTPWAGIDRSNTRSGSAVLWPKNPQKVADELRDALSKKFRLRQFGVVIVDSFCVPHRKGVLGVALACSGFLGVDDKRGGKDLFGNVLKYTQEATADSLATMANFVMGQGNESTPFAVIHNAPVTFSGRKNRPSDLQMKGGECLYAPLYARFPEA